MSTLKELRDEVTLNAGVIANENFPQARMNRIVNEAQKYVQTEIMSLGVKKWEKSIVPTLSAGTYMGENVLTIDIPTDLPNLLETPNSIPQIECTGATSSGIAKAIDSDLFGEKIINTYSVPTEKQPAFMRLAGKLYLSPNTVASANVIYYKALVALSSDSDESEIPVEYQQHIIKKAVLDIDDILGKLNDKVEASAQLKKDIADTVQAFTVGTVENKVIAQENGARLQ